MGSIGVTAAPRRLVGSAESARRSVARWGAAAFVAAALAVAASPTPVSAGETDASGLEAVGDAQACHVEGMRHGGEIAFWGHRAVVACGADDDDVANDGFSVIDIRDPRRPVTHSTFRCVGSSSDVAAWGDLVFLAADSNNGAKVTPQADLSRPYEFTGVVKNTGQGPCAEDVADDPPDGPRPDFFRGVRVVSIADPRNPEFVTHVETETPAGAHNLSVVPDIHDLDADGRPTRLLVFVADPSGPTRIITVPLGVPPEEVKARTKLMRGADGTPFNWASGVRQESNCHDITFFMPRRLATCHKTFFGTAVLSVEHSLLAPQRLDFIDAWQNAAADPLGSLTDPTHVSHHSGAFSWDGEKLVITDEYLTTDAVCGLNSVTPGAVSIYDVSNIDGRDPGRPRWTLAGRHASPRVVGPELCTSKQVNVVPLASGRDVAAISWLGGGTSLVDFTNPARTVEEGRFVAEPGTSRRSWSWASYWYDGHVYASNVYGCLYGLQCFGTQERGVDVLEPTMDTALRGELAKAIRLRRYSSGLQDCLQGVPPSAKVLRCAP